MPAKQRQVSAKTKGNSWIYLVLLFVGLLTLALVVRSGLISRKDPGQPMSTAMREALAESGVPQLSAEDARLIDQKYGTSQKMASGLRYVVRSPGIAFGTPSPGMTVTAHYDGKLLDGSPFDSSYQRGQPITFKLGVGGVIKGWDEAFQHMRKGERRTLIIPYWLAYGTAGRPPNIPPKATLVFEVELIDFK